MAYVCHGHAQEGRDFPRWLLHSARVAKLLTSFATFSGCFESLFYSRLCRSSLWRDFSGIWLLGGCDVSSSNVGKATGILNDPTSASCRGFFLLRQDVFSELTAAPTWGTTAAAPGRDIRACQHLVPHGTLFLKPLHPPRGESTRSTGRGGRSLKESTPGVRDAGSA